MPNQTYLSQLVCRRCHRASFIRQIEHDKSDWIAKCDACEAQNIVIVQHINNVVVLLPDLPIAGVRP